MKDNYYTFCERCGEGTYRDIGLYDRIDQTLTCDNLFCGHKVPRHEDSEESSLMRRTAEETYEAFRKSPEHNYSKGHSFSEWYEAYKRGQI